MNSEALQKFLEEIKTLPEFAAFGSKPVNVRSRGLFGVAPLHVAAARGDVSLIEALLEAGAEIDVRGDHGHTPLHEAVGQGHVDAARLLVKRGASETVCNDWKQTAADIARAAGKPELVALFSKRI